MKSRRSRVLGLVAVVGCLAMVAAACGRSSSNSSGSKKGTSGAPAAVPGFDPSAKTITLGVLTPLTGIASIIGIPLTNGNRVYWDSVNASGGVDGKYQVKLIVKDNKYTTGDTVTQYGAIKNQVAAFQQILGTAPTNAVLPSLTRDNILAGPATLDAPWYEQKDLMPILAPYQIQAINGITYYVNNMGGKGKKICALTSDDPYGNAGEEGAKFAAEQDNFKLAADVKFAVTAQNPNDFASQVDELKSAGCEMVWYTGLPTASIGLFGRAEQVGFAPQWIAQSPAWVTLLASNAGLAPYLSKHFILVSEGTTWGNTSVPGMKTLMDATQKYSAQYNNGKQQAPDIYYVFGWLQAEAMNQILTQAVKDGDLSRAGIINAMSQTHTLTFNGIVKDETYGLPAQRDPSRFSTLLKVTPDTLASNGGLSLVAADAENFTTSAAKAFKFTS